MRNLKKFLALVLAMMMAMSLMVTANAAKLSPTTNKSAQFPDGGSIATKEFAEAVDVLAGMGIFKGDDKNNFNPSASITRAETAAIIYRLVTADVTDAQAELYRYRDTPFTDVPTDKWYAGYVGFLYNKGIIKGTSATTFNPTANVTGYEALAMILRAVGYDQNDEFTGANWTLPVSATAQNKGVLIDVDKANYGGPMLWNAARRDVVASMLFRTAAYVPQVVYTPAYHYTDTGMTGGPVGSTLNPTLGYQNFGLTYHRGIIVGNQATGETKTKIGFSVNPTIASSFEGNAYDDAGTGALYIKKTLTAAEITDVIDEAAYYYFTDDVDAENVTLSFDWTTDLKMFNHAVRVWYDCRGDGRTVQKVSYWRDLDGEDDRDAGEVSTVNFYDDLHAYALWDDVVKSQVVVATDANLSNKSHNANDTVLRTTGGLGYVVANPTYGQGFTLRTGADADKAMFNYAFAAMDADNWTVNGAANGVSGLSPIKSNNDMKGVPAGDPATDDEWPLYLVISNTPGNVVDVVITLNLTISEVVQDNNNTAPLTTGILTQNGDGTAYFDTWDQISPFNGTPDYSNIANASMLDTDPNELVLGTYVAAVTVTGTAPGHNDTGVDLNVGTTPSAGTNIEDGNLPNGVADDGQDEVVTGGTQDLSKVNVDDFRTVSSIADIESTFYYHVKKLTKTVRQQVRDYDVASNTVYFMDGSKLEQSIFARAVDGSFKSNAEVMAPTVFDWYKFYLDEAGDYLFWERDKGNTEFIYGTYVDFHSELASSEFTYPMVYVNQKGDQKQQRNIALSAEAYDKIELPKRDSTDLNTAGFLHGTYIGYELTGNAINAVTDTLQDLVDGTGINSTEFLQATQDTVTNASTVDFNDFGKANTTVTASSVTLGAAPVGGSGNLFLTNDTTFVVVDGAGLGNQTATVYHGLAEFLDGHTSKFIDVTTVPVSSGRYLDNDGCNNKDNPGHSVPETYPWEMIYYKVGDFTYGQSYDPSALAVEIVFIPAAMIDVTDDEAVGNLHFVGDSSYRIINEDDDATKFIVYDETGAKHEYWIAGQANIPTGDAGIIVANGDNVFYKLLDTGRTAHDGNTIYALDKFTNAATTIIGQYWDDDDATLKTTIVNNGDYLATTYSDQVGYIDAPTPHDDVSKLFNVQNSTVVNLDPRHYPGIETYKDLNNAGSMTDNSRIPVSCIFSGVTAKVIFVNYDATPSRLP